LPACERCNKEFIAKKRINPSRFCSLKCRYAARYDEHKSPPHQHGTINCEDCGSLIIAKRSTKKLCLRCRGKRGDAKKKRPLVNGECERCSKPFLTSMPHKRFCTEGCRAKTNYDRGVAAYIYTCQGCGREYRPKTKDRNKYCSKECCYEHKRASHTGLCIAFIEVCSECSSTYVATRQTKRKLCGRECYLSAERKRSKQLNTAKKGIVPPRPCKECGVIFVPEYGNKKRTFCSDMCGTRHSRRIRAGRERARLRGLKVEHVDPLVVLARDGYACQICGIPTPRRLRGTTHPHAPEVDHIIPLSRGGAHSYANTQCACRSCNHKKSDHLDLVA
jgi:5-methylcytosine-specific restriction endonuclease McrA